MGTFAPSRGNLSEYNSHLAHALAEQPGVEHVYVLANRVDYAPAEERIGDKLTVLRVWTLGSATSLARVVRVARALAPDVVHMSAGIRTWGAGKLVNLCGAALPLLFRVVGLRVLTTLHTIADTVSLDVMGPEIGWVTRLGMYVATWLYLRSTLTTVTLESMQTALAANHRRPRVRHVAHGTFGARVRFASVAEPRILCFGFFGKYKNPEMLVAATARLRERGIRAELVLAGGRHPYFPEIYDQLLERYRDREWVKFTGYVPDDMLEDLFTRAAVVVLPYQTNAGASGVMNMCRSYGRPMVTSRDPALREQVESEGGMALDFGTEDELTEALATIIGDDRVQLRMGSANLQVAHRTSPATQAARFVELYDTIAPTQPKTTEARFAPSPIAASVDQA